MGNVLTGDIRAALRRKFPSPEWALMFEVRDAAGFDAGRSADAIAMNTWPSRGLELQGVEIKVSRSDWKRELDNPAKAESIAAYCDRWWVAAPRGIVPVEQVPVGWGLLELDGERWRTTKDAPTKEAKPLTRSFLAALLRRASSADEDQVSALVRAQVAEKEARINDRIASEVKARAYEAERTLEAMRKFEEASGLKISDSWSAGHVGAAVKVIDTLGVQSTYGGIFSVVEQVEALAKRTREALSAAGFEPTQQINLPIALPKRAKR